MAALPPLPKATSSGRRRNPASTSDRLKRAVNFYEDFHWGDTARKVKRRKVSPPPRTGVKLGKLVAVAYETRKGGEKAVWEHEFGEEGGRRPDLVMDIDNEKLHIVGGDYRVEDVGIVD